MATSGEPHRHFVTPTTSIPASIRTIERVFSSIFLRSTTSRAFESKVRRSCGSSMPGGYQEHGKRVIPGVRHGNSHIGGPRPDGRKSRKHPPGDHLSQSAASCGGPRLSGSASCEPPETYATLVPQPDSVSTARSNEWSTRPSIMWALATPRPMQSAQRRAWEYLPGHGTRLRQYGDFGGTARFDHVTAITM